jgi:hypothetical protein
MWRGVVALLLADKQSDIYQDAIACCIRASSRPFGSGSSYPMTMEVDIFRKL